MLKLFLALRLQAAVLALWGTGGTYEEVDRRTVRPHDAARAALIVAYLPEPELLLALAVPESSLRMGLVNPSTGACGPGQLLFSHDIDVQRRRCAGLTERGAYRAMIKKLADAAAYCARADSSTARRAAWPGTGAARLEWTGAGIGRRRERLRVRVRFLRSPTAAVRGHRRALPCPETVSAAPLLIPR